MAKILLVEDEPDLATLMSGWLARYEHDIDIFSNGDAAFERIQKQPNLYDLLILDLMLPGKGGLQICNEYRKLGNAPVLIVTAKNTTALKKRAFEQGADDYVTKPFHLKELAARVSALLQRGTLTSSNSIGI